MPLIIFLFFMILISEANVGFTLSIVNKVKHIKRKFTIMEVTMISMPKKKSPAKLLPKIPVLAMTPLRIIAAYGVWNRGWILVKYLGKIPSSAQANISLETERSIAGRSLIKAIAAPATITTVKHDGSK